MIEIPAAALTKTEAPVGPNAPQAGTYIPAVQRPVHLPVQPIITSSRTVSVMDLASQLPTAAAPSADNAPVPPAQPTGALGQLSAQLAGSVVKGVYVPEATGLGAAVITLMILLTLFTSGKVYAVSIFGSRRDGYAHAPRSDVAAATSNLYFATPFSMSYVTAERHYATRF
jgi:hypothetical protein